MFFCCYDLLSLKSYFLKLQVFVGTFLLLQHKILKNLNFVEQQSKVGLRFKGLLFVVVHVTIKRFMWS